MPQVIPTRPDYFKYLAYFCSSVLVACSSDGTRTSPIVPMWSGQPFVIDPVMA